MNSIELTVKGGLNEQFLKNTHFHNEEDTLLTFSSDEWFYIPFVFRIKSNVIVDVDNFLSKGVRFCLSWIFTSQNL